jgi:hypothetical protein
MRLFNGSELVVNPSLNFEHLPDFKLPLAVR